MASNKTFGVAVAAGSRQRPSARFQSRRHTAGVAHWRIDAPVTAPLTAVQAPSTRGNFPANSRRGAKSHEQCSGNLLNEVNFDGLTPRHFCEICAKFAKKSENGREKHDENTSKSPWRVVIKVCGLTIIFACKTTLHFALRMKFPEKNQCHS